LAEASESADPVLVEELVASYEAAIADGEIFPDELLGLYEDVNDVLESMQVSPELIEAFKADVEAILANSELTQDDVQLIVGDIVVVIQAFVVEDDNDSSDPAEIDAAFEEMVSTGI
jgi:hypothetical protein